MGRREILQSVDDTDETRNFEKIAPIGLSGISWRKHSAAILSRYVALSALFDSTLSLFWSMATKSRTNYMIMVIVAFRLFQWSLLALSRQNLRLSISVLKSIPFSPTTPFAPRMPETHKPQFPVHTFRSLHQNLLRTSAHPQMEIDTRHRSEPNCPSH